MRESASGSKNKEIKLTNIEMKLFKYLLNNANALVRIEDINSNVWENKKMTLFTLRNKINSIRKQTYYKLIKNVSSHGYMMDTITTDYIPHQ